MRIVAVADTHTYQNHLGVLPAGDVFIHAGDMLQHGTLDELEVVAKWMRQLPHRHKVVIAGNHDWCFARRPSAARKLLGGGILFLEDEGVTIEGVSFWGSPWQPEFFGWAFNLKRGPQIAAKWKLIPDRVDVLVTHGPPRGIRDLTHDGPAGCDDLLEAIAGRHVGAHLFGHIHEDGGTLERDGTLYANVTTWECERGATVIDVEAGVARAVHVPKRNPATEALRERE